MVKSEGVAKTVIPSIFILSIRSIPWVVIGLGKCFLFRGRCTIISCDLVLFNFKLLAVAHSVMCRISSGMDDELELGSWNQ